MKTYSLASILILLLIAAGLTLPNAEGHQRNHITHFAAHIEGEHVLLRWEAQGLDAQHRLDLQIRNGNEWMSALPQGDHLPPTGSRWRALPQDKNFYPLTWRLVVRDVEGQIIEQRAVLP